MADDEAKLTEAEAAELEALEGEVIAKGGPNKGQVKASAPQAKRSRFLELMAKQKDKAGGQAELEAQRTAAKGDEPAASEPPAADRVETIDVASWEQQMMDRLERLEKRVYDIERALKAKGVLKTSRFLRAAGLQA